MNYLGLALTSIAQGKNWQLHGNTYADLLWFDEPSLKPTEAEVNAEIARLQAEHEANQYQRDREKAYPSYADQFDLLYHGGYDAWKASIDAVKQQFPKPTE